MSQALKGFERVRERNRAYFNNLAESWKTRAAKSFKEKFGYDPIEQVSKPGFTLHEAGKQLREKYKLTEDQTSSQLYALTTGLVTLDMSNEYQAVECVYRDLANIKPSTKSEESYFPLQRADVPVPLEDNEAAPESGLGGVLTRIKNYRFARTIKYSATLEEDDQTGQVRDAATELGGLMAYAEELWWLQQVFNVYKAANIRTAGGIVPNECIAGQAAANYGGPTCVAGAPTRDNLMNLWTAADYVTDLEGNFALVKIDAGLFANADKFQVKTIMASAFNPNGASASTTAIGGAFMENILKGEFEAHFTPFMKYLNQASNTSLAGSGNQWALGQAGKMGSFQDRTPLGVTMENPLSGASWETNSRRVKAERRFGAGVTLPEFTLRGN